VLILVVDQLQKSIFMGIFKCDTSSDHILGFNFPCRQMGKPGEVYRLQLLQ
jgi:hypothetical protein